MQCQSGNHSLGLILPWLNGAGLLLRTGTVSEAARRLSRSENCVNKRVWGAM